MNTQNGSRYHEVHARSLADPEGFWGEAAREIDWIEPAKKIFDPAMGLYGRWFAGAVVNTCYNALDRHVAGGRADQLALIHDSPLAGGTVTRLTYAEMLHEVKTLAAIMQDFGVAKGDRVILYMPMVPEAVVAMLACARIGAVHSVVFGGFAAKELATRIEDAKPKLIFSASCGLEPGRIVQYKPLLDEAIRLSSVKPQACIILQRPQQACELVAGRDHDWAGLRASAIAAKKSADCVPVLATDPLYILYTSGTTGIPKGVVRDNGGHLVALKWSMFNLYGVKPGEAWWCASDIGWVVGHSYIVYGPLANGATSVLYEGTPDFPDRDRWWSIIERYGVTTLYTAPTAIRTFMKWGTEQPAAHDLSSLRVLGSVGEPINPEAWIWYWKHIGQGRCPIVDTWWQTETGAIMISPLPGVTTLKPGSATFPLPGIGAEVVDDAGRQVEHGGGYLTLTRPWPAMLRGIYGDPQRYRQTYWSRFEGRYFAGDGAKIDEEGYFWLLGRVDDVMNVSGHRVSTTEVESALVDHPSVAEAAVVGANDATTGQTIIAFVTLKLGLELGPEHAEVLRAHVVEKIGAIARPKVIIFTDDLPKTRSGKIMRRLLRDVAEGRDLGDTTTLADPAVVAELRRRASSGAAEQ